MLKILTVCLGNICRSPAAEGIVRDQFKKAGAIEGQDFEIDSAGTGAWHVGEAPDERSQAVCARYGLDISNQSARQLKPKDGAHYDFILGMDQSNLENIKHVIDPQYWDKVHLFDAHEVNDPYFGINDGFEIMYQQLESAAEKWVKDWGW